MKKMMKFLKAILKVLPMICELLKYFQEWFSKWFRPEIAEASSLTLESDENVVNENKFESVSLRSEQSSQNSLSKKGNKRPNRYGKIKNN